MFHALILGGLLGGLLITGCNESQLKSQVLNTEDKAINKNEAMKTDTATFGTGCFWCTEAVFQELEGVLKVTSGYSGGHVVNPTYEQVCSKQTGHAEVVQIVYDPEKISFDELLKVFWEVHDPTTLDRQGNDVGLSYRSAIFYLSQEQQVTAQQVIREIDASGKWPGPVVTEVAPAGDFWDAEEEHQNYLQKHPYGYTCHYIRPEWQLAEGSKV